MKELDIIGTTFGTEIVFQARLPAALQASIRQSPAQAAQLRRNRRLQPGIAGNIVLPFRKCEYYRHRQPGSGSCNAEDGVIVEVGSPDDPDFRFNLTHRYPPRIISNGDRSHRSHHVLFTFKTLFPALEPTGYYINESLRSFRSAPTDLRHTGPPQVSPIDYFFDLTRILMTTELDPALDWGFRGYARNSIDEVVIFRHCCVVRKKVGGNARLRPA